MIIGLTWQMLQACRHWGTERHKELLTGNRQVSSRGHEVSMPPIAWFTLAEILRDKSFHPTGRHRKTANSKGATIGTRAACTKIWNEVANLQLHPALRGETFMGARGDVLLVWPEVSRVVRWTVFPRRGEPVILIPEVGYVTMRGPLGQTFPEVVTSWKAQSLGSVDVEGAWLDPADHKGWSDSDSVAV